MSVKVHNHTHLSDSDILFSVLGNVVKPILHSVGTTFVLSNKLQV